MTPDGGWGLHVWMKTKGHEKEGRKGEKEEEEEERDGVTLEKRREETCFGEVHSFVKRERKKGREKAFYREVH